MIKKFICILAVLFALQFTTAKDAQATCCVCAVCPIIKLMHTATEFALEMDINTKIQSFFTSNVINDLTMGLIQPNLRIMTMEISTAAHAIIPQIGAMIDGQVLAKTVLDMQTLRAEAARDQMPSVSMCEFATLSRTVGAADYRRDVTQRIMSKWQVNRLMGTRGLSGAAGVTSIIEDNEAFFRLFLSTYCDPDDQKGNLGAAYGSACAGSDLNPNLDIDYTRLIESNRTLGVDFTIPVAEENERDIFALATNLYSGTLFVRPEQNILNNPDNQDEYLDMMSLVAKKSVAANSFFAQVALRTENPTTFTSYFEDMYNLTKVHYRDPAFYAKLYDNPANVLRQQASMQGIGLMQQRDLFESQIRSEMLLSVLLETKLAEDTKDLLGGLAQ